MFQLLIIEKQLFTLATGTLSRFTLVCGWSDGGSSINDQRSLSPMFNAQVGEKPQRIMGKKNGLSDIPDVFILNKLRQTDCTLIRLLLLVFFVFIWVRQSLHLKNRKKISNSLNKERLSAVLQHAGSWVRTPTNVCEYMIYKYIDCKGSHAMRPL